ncbi:metal-dependent transcriptional regulator [Lutibacter flavus]|uniref:Transcriptional regulator MntR n=1 Tax=Lutibacter flavus TaxID=691689 RepID=A0A238X9F1_9FLAO|nr:metal-dependent transcriptional regulator [Lutibacter flavus]SNR55191.1 iron (metal) dependent repressor, DtxR family [Lutibacter flavus]
MHSQSEENYLKAIYSIELHNGKSVSTNNIAEKLKTKASSVTDMIKKLAEKNLVNYKKYQGTSLTSKGKKIAVKIVRKHRLWEAFLVNKLDFSWDEVHDLAEQLEHIKSDSLIDKLEEFLDYPAFDPHGDPIPDKDGNIEHHKNLMLSSVDILDECTVIGVKDSSSIFLKFLDKKNIKLGSTLKVISKEEFDNSMVIENNKNNYSISHQISKNLFVKKI